jgi:hypothetical protein
VVALTAARSVDPGREDASQLALLDKNLVHHQIGWDCMA